VRLVVDWSVSFDDLPLNVIEANRDVSKAASWSELGRLCDVWWVDDSGSGLDHVVHDGGDA
jgi:hypothetical protein